MILKLRCRFINCNCHLTAALLYIWVLSQNVLKVFLKVINWNWLPWIFLCLEYLHFLCLDFLSLFDHASGEHFTVCLLCFVFYLFRGDYQLLSFLFSFLYLIVKVVQEFWILYKINVIQIRVYALSLTFNPLPLFNHVKITLRHLVSHYICRNIKPLS